MTRDTRITKSPMSRDVLVVVIAVASGLMLLFFASHAPRQLILQAAFQIVAFTLLFTGPSGDKHVFTLSVHGRRVPHISLVFREMWDTAGLSLKLPRCPQARTGVPVIKQNSQTS